MSALYDEKLSTLSKLEKMQFNTDISETVLGRHDDKNAKNKHRTFFCLFAISSFFFLSVFFFPSVMDEPIFPSVF